MRSLLYPLDFFDPVDVIAHKKISHKRLHTELGTNGSYVKQLKPNFLQC
jgi:hypothetical protein